MTPFPDLLSLPGVDSDGRLFIAGPCSAESRRQMIDTARPLAEAGIKVFRAGVWKPRTHPGGFEGMGLPALGWLAEVRRTFGMITATEVATRDHVRAAVDSGVDILWIGARTSANPFAVQEIADALAEICPDVPVLVKNPVNPDIELWIGALQRLYSAGVRRLGAIHRGFSTYGDSPFRNPPHWSIPFELRRRLPGLPVIGDPSHIAGRSDLVIDIALRAMRMDFDGLIVECHISPDEALSDGRQQLTPRQFAALLGRIPPRGSGEAGPRIEELRRMIDNTDDELLDVIVRRMAIAREIGRCKREAGMPVVQLDRYHALMDNRMAAAERLGLSPAFMQRLLGALHEESVRQQLKDD